jgi:hypothetical protein
MAPNPKPLKLTKKLKENIGENPPISHNQNKP